LRKNLERLIEMLADIPGLDLTLTTNGSVPLEKSARAEGGGSQPRHGQPRLARRGGVPQDERRRLPGSEVLNGIDAAAAAGLAPIKINMVVKRGANEDSVIRWRAIQGQRPHRALHRVHGRRRDQRWRMYDVLPSVEIVRMIGEKMPLETVEPNYTGESQSAGATETVGGESA